MNKSTKTIFMIKILLLLNLNALYAVDYKGDRTWMLRPTSARGAAMGRTLVAIVDNANTVFWNPGGITFLKSFNLSYCYDPYFSVINYIKDSEIHNLSLSKKIKSSYAICFNIRRLYEDFPGDLGYSSKDFDVGIAFGYRKNNIGIGINAKYLYSKITEYIASAEGTAFSMDIGVLYSKDFHIKNRNLFHFNLGISLLNISKGMKYDLYNSPQILDWNDLIDCQLTSGLPNTFRFGYSLLFKIPKKLRKLTLFTITHNLEYSDVINQDKNFPAGIRTPIYAPVIYKYIYFPWWEYRSLGSGFEVSIFEILNFRFGYYYQKGGYKNKAYMDYNGYTYGIGIFLPIKYFYESSSFSLNYDYSQFPHEAGSPVKQYRYFKIHSFGFHYNF